MVTFTLGLGLDGELTYRRDYETARSGDFFDIKQGTPTNWPVAGGATRPRRSTTCGTRRSTAAACSSARKNPESWRTACSETLGQLHGAIGAGAAAATSNLQPVAGDNFAFTAKYQTQTGSAT